MKKQTKRRPSVPRRIIEDGLTLEVPADALRGQVSERIAWHQQTMDSIATELAALPVFSNLPNTDVELQQYIRRNNLKQELANHEERIRFLRFVGVHIPKGRVYRLEGRELQLMEIVPVAPRR